MAPAKLPYPPTFEVDAYGSNPMLRVGFKGTITDPAELADPDVDGSPPVAGRNP